MTAPAVTAWAVHLGRLRLDRPLSLIGSVPSVAIFTVLAIMELVADKLPNTPNRTAPVGLIARILTGGLTGACVAAGGAQALAGAVLGAVGGVVGCFGGYEAAERLVNALGTRTSTSRLSRISLPSLVACGSSSAKGKSSFRRSRCQASASYERQATTRGPRGIKMQSQPQFFGFFFMQQCV